MPSLPRNSYLDVPLTKHRRVLGFASPDNVYCTIYKLLMLFFMFKIIINRMVL